MKRVLLLFLMITGGMTTLSAQDSSWQATLQGQLQVLEKSAPPQWPAHADTLAQLAGAYPQVWLLQYYAGWAYTQLSFKAEKKKAEEYCDKAAPFVKKALEMQPHHTETLTLMGYWLSARINAVPSRGASLGAESRQYAEKAIDADPANPRASLVKALNIYYTPAIFGGGKKRARSTVVETGEKFSRFTPADALSPNWGKNIYDVLNASYQ
ncbi:hypothetical protein HF324_15920 [Chitinophaga oryzae]|uniref:Tetratricopeptide repeat protein n=1 Tax=Chitinophaga oryzae TaxID=2725414 RepID=A0ABX6LH67_9BACT|nr:hypothetical protein [Chitinophaga oryzae]QJB39265.1 hypothetical protein HF324_15920 [Chitinophaga oryzae]